jgi:hypothetical protein
MCKLLNTQLQILQLYDVQDVKHPNANFEGVNAAPCHRGNVAWGDFFWSNIVKTWEEA